jgi:hypothetical protein
MRSGRIFYIIVLLICVFESARLWTISPEPQAHTQEELDALS